MNSLIVTLKYFITIMAELTVLFVAISTIIALALMYINQDKLKKWMSGKGILGNLMAVLFGAVTPFCACSTVPITLGFLQAGIPFGTVMSFVIASPLMDPLVFSLLTAFMGWKVAVGFLVLTSAFAIIFGIILEKLGWADQVKNVRIKGSGYQTEVEEKQFSVRLKKAFFKAWGDYKAVFIYMIIGVAIGAAIYGYMPTDLLARIASPDNPFAVLIAALIGILSI